MSTIDFRYSLPLLILVPAAAALGWQRLTGKAPGVPEAQPPVQPGDDADIQEPAKAN
ncbi:hypothetical protein [Allorhizocola rhizosphaerae]|uniref:hypothetical protein n=1 Tax=Allorhizocola rhizosphaerae TaxID=1872709 RepID=UPI0013C348F6|nr:hypothetical protein [Allorhizocola rhizosphaerae]